MNVSVVAPLVFALGAAYIVLLLHDALPPRLTAWLLVVVGSAAAISAVWLIATLSLAYVGQQWRIDRWLGWCDDIVSSHDVVGAPLGAVAVASLVAMSLAAIRTLRRYRRGWRPSSGDATEVIDDRRVIAHAIPGRGRSAGTVVISTGLIAALNPRELRAVMAHERSHLVHRHHRFLAAIDVAAAMMPLLRPLRANLRLATERWADEDAALLIRSRRVVASAVARAALATAPPPFTLAISGSSTLTRVSALLGPADVRSPIRVATVSAAACMAAALTAATVQVHHALGLFAHLCN